MVSLAMRTIPLALACLLYAGHGRRLQTNSHGLQETVHDTDRVDEEAWGLDSPESELRLAQGRSGTLKASEAIAALLLSFNPALSRLPATNRGFRRNLAASTSDEKRARSPSAIRMGGLVRQVSGAEFEKEIQDCSTPILLDVFATWCPPCQFLAPQLEEVAQKLEGRVRVLKIDSDQEEEVSAQLQVQGLPTIMVIQDMEIKARVEGAMMADEIVGMVEHIAFGAPKPEGLTKAGETCETDVDLGAALKSADVVFFDLEGCPFCKKAKDALTDKDIDFKILQITPYRDALMDATGKTSAPSVWIKGTYIGGCNDGTKSWHGVLPMLANGKFEEMLRS